MGASTQVVDPDFVGVSDVPINMPISFSCFVDDLKNRARLIRVRDKGSQSKRGRV